MARGNFGERLKRERELREVTLDEINSATRISNRFLEAMENEDWQKLPGGVFNRGFVRSIARFLGLDEEGLLAEYDMAHGAQEQAAPKREEVRIPSPPKWVPVAAVLAVAAAGGVHRGRNLCLALFCGAASGAAGGNGERGSFARREQRGVVGIERPRDAAAQCAGDIRYNHLKSKRLEAGTKWSYSARKSSRICVTAGRLENERSPYAPPGRTYLQRIALKY